MSTPITRILVYLYEISRCENRSSETVYHWSDSLGNPKNIGHGSGFNVLIFNCTKVNGFPNSYWGWGGEDDDMNIRIRKQALKIARPNPKIGR